MKYYHKFILIVLISLLSGCETHEARPYCGDKKCNGTETIATCKEDCTCDDSLKQFCDTFGGRLDNRLLKELNTYGCKLPLVLDDDSCFLCSEGGGAPLIGPTRCEPPPPCQTNADCKDPYPICVEGLCLECGKHTDCNGAALACILTHNGGRIIDGMCGCKTYADCRAPESNACKDGRCVSRLSLLLEDDLK